MSDPDRRSGWLPVGLPPPDSTDASRMRLEWSAGGASGRGGYLQVREVPSGGASVVWSLDDALGERTRVGLPRVLDEALANLAREVADNLTPG
nr:hypothetical protein [Micromonospora sp. NBRC 107566]